MVAKGLSRVQGEVILTPFVLPGEVVDAERTGPRKGTQRARLVNVRGVLQGARCRAMPLLWTLRRLPSISMPRMTRSLARKRRFSPRPCGALGIWKSQAIPYTRFPARAYGYGIGAQLHVENGRIGYREMKSRRLIPVEICPISSPKINEGISSIKPYGERPPVAAFD